MGNAPLNQKWHLASAFQVSPKDLEDSVPPETVFEQNRIEWSSVTGYVILLIVLPILFYLLTHTHGIWEIGCLIIVDVLILAISIASHGVDETIRFFANSFSVVKKTSNSNDYKVHILFANQVIKYAYTYGSLTSLIYLLVIQTKAPDRFHHPNVVVIEAAVPIVYSVLLAELWIRPFKHRVEKRLVESMSNNKQ